MHRPRHKFLPSAALAVYQDSALSRRDRTDRLFQLLHRCGAADDVLQRIAGGGITLQGKVLPAESHFFERPADRQLNLVHQSG